MAKIAIKLASTSKLLRLFIQDATSSGGAGLTGLVYNSNLVAAPASTVTVGTATSGGSVDVGSHVYAVTYLDSLGKETTASANSTSITIVSGTQTVPLSAIPTGGTGVVKRNLYRSKANTTTPLYLLTTIADDTTTTYTDTTADASLGTATPPTVNGTGLAFAYLREGDAAPTQVALAAATVGTWTSGGFKEVNPTYLPGLYEVGLPNAALSSGGSVTCYLFGATNMVPTLAEIELDGFDYVNGYVTGRPEKISLGTGPSGVDQLIEYEADGVTAHVTHNLTAGTPGNYVQRT